MSVTNNNKNFHFSKDDIFYYKFLIENINNKNFNIIIEFHNKLFNYDYNLYFNICSLVLINYKIFHYQKNFFISKIFSIKNDKNKKKIWDQYKQIFNNQDLDLIIKYFQLFIKTNKENNSIQKNLPLFFKNYLKNNKINLSNSSFVRSKYFSKKNNKNIKIDYYNQIINNKQVLIFINTQDEKIEKFKNCKKNKIKLFLKDKLNKYDIENLSLFLSFLYE